jgi:hypothetical protein
VIVHLRATGYAVNGGSRQHRTDSESDIVGSYQHAPRGMQSGVHLRSLADLLHCTLRTSFTEDYLISITGHWRGRGLRSTYSVTPKRKGQITFG